MFRIAHLYGRQVRRAFHFSIANSDKLLSNDCAARHIEVERKFLATLDAVSYLRSNGSGSAFSNYQILGKKTIHDTYYDRGNLQLMSQGLYVRRRNGQWEAKIRQAGDFVNSTFTEIQGYDTVSELIKQTMGGFVDCEIEEVLEPCAIFVTERESWILDGIFQADVDTTDFGHTVGEVELTRVIQHPERWHDNGKLGDEIEIRAQMNQDIKAFMLLHPHAFPPGRPKGKLSAYFERFGTDSKILKT